MRARAEQFLMSCPKQKKTLTLLAVHWTARNEDNHVDKEQRKDRARDQDISVCICPHSHFVCLLWTEQFWGFLKRLQ